MEVEEGKSYKVVENFLQEDHFKDLQAYVMGMTIHWRFSGHVHIDDLGHFTHNIYSGNRIGSDMHEDFVSNLEMYLPDMSALIRARFVLYPRTDVIHEHARHQDFSVPNKGMLLYMNTNNGFTRLEDGTKIGSVANRALFHDGSEWHNSTTCTDQRCRVVLAVNYI